MNVIIYSTLNVGITPFFGDTEANNSKDEHNYDFGNHIKGTIQWSGIPIYLIGEVVYRQIKDKNINIIPNFIMNFLSGFDIDKKKIEEAVYRLTWQTFFNSLIYNNFKEIFIDDLLILLGIFIESFID